MSAAPAPAAVAPAPTLSPATFALGGVWFVAKAQSDPLVPLLRMMGLSEDAVLAADNFDVKLALSLDPSLPDCLVATHRSSLGSTTRRHMRDHCRVEAASDGGNLTISCILLTGNTLRLRTEHPLYVLEDVRRVHASSGSLAAAPGEGDFMVQTLVGYRKSNQVLRGQLADAGIHITLKRRLYRMPPETAGRFAVRLRGLASAALPTFETLRVAQADTPGVYRVQLSNHRANAMNQAFWTEVKQCFDFLGSEAENCRAVILGGDGKHFTSGLDLEDHLEPFSAMSAPSPAPGSPPTVPAGTTGPAAVADMDVARRAFAMNRFIRVYQDAFTSLEECGAPVIAAIHGACLGGGVDLISAADIRLCSADAFFQVKEVEIGIAADVGTLQRLPRIIGSESVVRELALTARRFSGEEAERIGLVSRSYIDKAAVDKAAMEMASRIASLSPVAVQGTKHNLLVARDTSSVSDALRYEAAWNAAMLQTHDIAGAAQEHMTGVKAQFADLPGHLGKR